MLEATRSYLYLFQKAGTQSFGQPLISKYNCYASDRDVEESINSLLRQADMEHDFDWSTTLAGSIIVHAEIGVFRRKMLEHTP
jgi:hypothetical protein